MAADFAPLNVLQAVQDQEIKKCFAKKNQKICSKNSIK